MNSVFYFWNTDYALDTNGDICNDFIENELNNIFPDADVIEQSDNFCTIKWRGIEFEVITYGNGDFTSHVAEIVVII